MDLDKTSRRRKLILIHAGRKHTKGTFSRDVAQMLFDDLFGKKRRKRGDIEMERRLFKILTKLYPTHSRRETIDAELRACMEQCESCTPLLLPTQNEVVSAVCGDTIATMNATLLARVEKMQTVYNYTLDTTNKIVSKLELNPATYNFVTGEVSEVFITAYINKAYERYQTGVAYYPLTASTSARKMGMEYWNRV